MNAKKVFSMMLAIVGIAALGTSASAATFAVGSNLDAVDVNPGDGLCVTEAGTCTLRAAIMEANASPGADIIDLTAINNPADPIVLTIQGVDEVVGPPDQPGNIPCTAAIAADAQQGDLDITEDLQIFGAGPALTVIKWSEQSLLDPDVGDRVFHVQALDGATINLVSISDLMVTGGSVGIPNDTDPDNPYNCEVTGEPGSIVAWQFKRYGGSIAIGPGAAVVLFEEAVHGPGGGEGPPPDVGPPEDPGEEEEGGITAVEFSRVAVLGNLAGADAGGLFVAAEATIADSVFSGNHSEANGGALYIDSATSISGTLIGTATADVPFLSGPLSAELLATPNSAENGGGIFDTGFHVTRIESSAINGNQATGGGGIAARAGIVINLLNSTVSGNVGKDVGGGITTNGTVNLQNVTVANNLATTDAPGGGAGLNSFGSGTYVFFNTILSNNLVQGGEGEATSRAANCGCSGGESFCPPGRMVSTGFNINDEATDSCSLEVALNDLPNTDPLLEPLAMNGGLTETHALPSVANGDSATSPAIDAGDTLRCPNNDQRGSLRPDDGDLSGSFDCDIGAYELFIARTDLHINNVLVPSRVDKGATFDAVVEIHNDDGNSAASGVTLSSTLAPDSGVEFVAADPTLGACDITSSSTVSCTLGTLDVGAIESVTATLSASTKGGYTMTSVVAATDPIDPVPGNNTVQTKLAVVGNSDIALSADPLAELTEQGDTLTVDFMVINNGEDVSSDTRMGMTIPAGTSFVAATSVPGSCAESAGEIVCTIGDLEVAGTAAIQVQLLAEEAREIAISASAGAEENDPDTSNNTVSLSTTVRANADLELTVTSASSVQRGGEITVSFGVTNNGPQAATNIVVTANLPSTLLSFVSSDNCTASDSVVTCTRASLGADERATFAAVLSADAAGKDTVSASVSADENDPDPDNNTGSVTITVSSPSGSSDGGCVSNPGGRGDATLLLLLVAMLLTLGLRRAAERPERAPLR